MTVETPARRPVVLYACVEKLCVNKQGADSWKCWLKMRCGPVLGNNPRQCQPWLCVRVRYYSPSLQLVNAGKILYILFIFRCTILSSVCKIFCIHTFMYILFSKFDINMPYQYVLKSIVYIVDNLVLPSTHSDMCETYSDSYIHTMTIFKRQI